MHFVQKVRNVFRGLLQRYGTQAMKRRLWDKEYASGRWSCLEGSGDRTVPALVEKYANLGNILDLGCGPGTTSLQFNPAAYTHYTGVDISDVAVEKARSRARGKNLAERNQYLQSDILAFEPSQRYDVILYGDSIYYIPQGQIAPMLTRYSQFLKSNGVFVARLFDISGKRHDILDRIQSNFEVAESHTDSDGACLIVFRPFPVGK